MATPRLTKQQLAQYARQAGFKENQIPMIVGIAGAESKYDPMALNPNVSTGDESYGLMQINMLGAMGPERLKQFGLKSKEQLYDPLTNLKAAKTIYEQQGPGAWSVYRSGAYKDFLPSEAEIKPTALQGTGMQVPTPQSPGASDDRSVEQILGQALGLVKKPELEKTKSLTETIKEQVVKSVLPTLIKPMGMFGGF
jgi:hypothetical protein